jgi:hypothetical protein
MINHESMTPGARSEPHKIYGANHTARESDKACIESAILVAL